MAMNLQAPDIRELKPRITVFGVGGAGGNAVNNMIEAGLDGVDFVVANTDAQALALSRASRIVQMGLQVTEGLGAGSQPEVGRAAAEEVIDEIRDHLAGAHMVFITAGTGEAQGEKRALTAAQAAINNPLLDDVSMKGARGLLISITGGRDMKLYEVDEAATRIREEVDSEANIIVGATFDESLEGTVRVSVVATGIDKPISTQAEVDDTEARIAQVAERLKQEARLRNTAAAPRAAAPVHAEPMLEMRAPVNVETVRQSAPVQPSVAEDIRIEPVQPRPVIAAAPVSQPMMHEEPMMRHEDSFIAPAPERAVVRPTRMPRIEDLPMPAQNQIAASRGAQSVPQPPAQADQKRMSLMQRLASVGFGRKDEDEAQPQAPVRHAPPPMQPAAPAPSAAHAEYMRRPAVPASRPAQGQLDQLGRAAPNRSSEEDQLEIPAFLRRQ